MVGALRALQIEQEKEATELEELERALEQERQEKEAIQRQAEDAEERMHKAEGLAATRLEELGQAKSEMLVNAEFVHKYEGVVSSLGSKLETAEEESESSHIVTHRCNVLCPLIVLS